MGFCHQKVESISLWNNILHHATSRHNATTSFPNITLCLPIFYGIHYWFGLFQQFRQIQTRRCLLCPHRRQCNDILLYFANVHSQASLWQSGCTLELFAIESYTVHPKLYGQNCFHYSVIDYRNFDFDTDYAHVSISKIKMRIKKSTSLMACALFRVVRIFRYTKQHPVYVIPSPDHMQDTSRFPQTLITVKKYNLLYD